MDLLGLCVATSETLQSQRISKLQVCRCMVQLLEVLGMSSFEAKIPEQFDCPKCGNEMSNPKNLTKDDDSDHGVLVYQCSGGVYVSGTERWFHWFIHHTPADVWVACAHIACVFVELIEVFHLD